MVNREYGACYEHEWQDNSVVKQEGEVNIGSMG